MSPTKSEKTRPLHTPRRVRVEPDAASGDPLAVHLSGRRLAVEAVLERWRIDDEWWREPISREYRAVVLDDGRVLTLYRDLSDDRWYAQKD